MGSPAVPLPTLQQLHLQTGKIKIPLKLNGAASAVHLDPREAPELKTYLKSFRHVSLSGPFQLSISAGVSAKVSYGVDVAIIPLSFQSDPPKDKHGVASVADSGNVFLSNISPPNVVALDYDREFITLQLKPPPPVESGIELPLFVAGWMSEGTTSTSTATCYIHCTVSVAGKAYFKTW